MSIDITVKLDETQLEAIKKVHHLKSNTQECKHSGRLGDREERRERK